MAATKTFTLSTTGTSFPSGATSEGPLTDTAAAAIFSQGSLALSTSYAQITVPAGATYVTLYMIANAIAITIAGANTDTGINIGSGWTYCKLGIVGGTSTLWAKSASATPTLYYQFN